VPVEVSYSSRARKTEFGDRPLPGGVVRIYQADGTITQLVGRLLAIPRRCGAALRGHAFDLTQRVQNTYGAGEEPTVATADSPSRSATPPTPR
jgi:hypothetical protein